MLKMFCVLKKMDKGVVFVGGLMFVLLRMMRSQVGPAGNIYTPADHF